MSLLTVGLSLVGLICVGLFVAVAVVIAMLVFRSAKGSLKDRGVDVTDGIDEEEFKILREIISKAIAAKKEASVKDMVKEAIGGESK